MSTSAAGASSETDVAEKRSRQSFRNIHISQILAYRLPPSGIVSILHRISGALLFLTLPFLVALWDMSLTSEESFWQLSLYTQSVAVRVVLLVLAWGFLHHLLAGVRYLLLDVHCGIDKAAARNSALLVFAISLPLAAVFGLWLFGVL
ncbi:MAG TPA: succinate dehydrogenase, cytochrome b556 subunit [Burkholderiaceae bacterium]|nr:succinate dehydrogenase, cytochrome b556 subunit [Burkholderiaceae bacterium]